jgi:hypothetical protein
MNCQQARSAFEDVFEGTQSLQHLPELEEHVAECEDCQVWQAQHRRVIAALKELDTVPVSADFTSRILEQLPDEVPLPQEGPHPQGEGHRVWQQVGERLEAWWASLSGPVAGRRLAPALALAATLLLAVGLLLGLQAGEAPLTPGAATGPASWLVVGGIGLILVAAVVALALFRRKE